MGASKEYVKSVKMARLSSRVKIKIVGSKKILLQCILFRSDYYHQLPYDANAVCVACLAVCVHGGILYAVVRKHTTLYIRAI